MAVWDLIARLQGSRNIEQLANRIADAVENAVWQTVESRLQGMTRAEARGYVFARSGLPVRAAIQHWVSENSPLSSAISHELATRARWQVASRILRRAVYTKAARQTPGDRAAA